MSKETIYRKDTIYREDVIDILESHMNERRGDFFVPFYKAIEEVNHLPSAEPTLYGYNIEHLALIARVMAKENVSPQKVIEILGDAERVVQMVLDEQAEIVEREVYHG